MSIKLQYARRCLEVIVGLMISAVGITMMLQANVGLEPWSVLQQGMSNTLGITYGTAAMIVGTAIIAIAFLCGESFGIGTLANIFICPICIDILTWLDWIPPMRSLGSGLIMLLIGMELLALGTWFYMKSGLGSGPRDALMVVLAKRTGRSVGLCRSTVEILAILVGWWLGGQVGVGTIITGIGIGTLFNLNFHLLHFNADKVHQEHLLESWQNLKKGTLTHE